MVDVSIPNNCDCKSHTIPSPSPEINPSRGSNRTPNGASASVSSLASAAYIGIHG